MVRRARVSIVAALAIGSVHCSLLLYNDDDFSGAESPPKADASVDGVTADASFGDARDASDASDAADARTFPDAAAVWPDNGHAYEVVAADEVDWHTAKEAAEKRGGHLVTITTAAENAFVFKLADANEKAWLFVVEDNLLLGPWIGCIQAPGSIEPDGGFGWVTGEPFVYSNFGESQPDNGGGENACQFFAYGERAPEWNDNVSIRGLSGYVVEYE